MNHKFQRFFGCAVISKHGAVCASFFWLGDIEWHSASGNPGHSMIRPKIGPHIFGAKQIAERLSPIFGGITLVVPGTAAAAADKPPSRNQSLS